MGSTREDHTTLDIYTISDGKVIRLTNKDTRLDKIGDKSNLYPLEDGSFTYISKYSASYTHYRLNKKGDAFEVVTESTTEDTIKNLPKKLDLKQIEWKPTQWYITSPEKQKEIAKKKLDIQAIQNGDYSSLKGTWIDGTGHEKGLVDDELTIKLSYFKELNGTLIRGYGPKNLPVGGAAVSIIPGGVPIVLDKNDDFVDPAPTDKDRIWTDQQLPRFASEFHYRIDD